MLTTLHPLRIYAIYTVLLKKGEAAIDEINIKSSYDNWVLYNMAVMAGIENSLKKNPLNAKMLLDAKQNGFSDKKIARLTGLTINEVEKMREAEGINPSYQIGRASCRERV